MVERNPGDTEVSQLVSRSAMVNLTIPAAPPAAALSGTGLSVTLSLDAKIQTSPRATVYVIARKPGEAIPIAVKRRSPANLQAPVVLTDADSMMSMHTLSMYDEVEVTARLSQQGGPTRRQGDWESATVTMKMGGAETLSIDTPVL